MKPIDEALAALRLQEKPNITQTALKYNIDRSTLSKRFSGKARAREDIISETLSLLTKVQQTVLVNYINKLSNKGLPPTVPIVRSLAGDIAY
jgi:hypothetical protein